MSNSVVETQLKATKQKLDKAIKARAEVEQNFKQQSELLLQFISKMSLASRGLDIKLDNKMASFRSLVAKSTTFEKLESELHAITKILQSLANSNDQNIRELDQQFKNAGKSLQQVKGLPDDLRRELRGLLKSNEDKKDNLLQYIPLLSDLVSIYIKVLNAKFDITPINNTDELSASTEKVPENIIEQFSTLLSRMLLSEEKQKKLAKIQQQLSTNISHQQLLEYLLQTFDLLSDDLQRERNSAESFLANLNEALSAVQAAVRTTLTEQRSNKKIYIKLNEQLEKQLNSMTKTVDSAENLAHIKDDINAKLYLIAQTITEKNELESKNQASLEKQLKSMQQQVVALEKQSKQFETRLHEQHLKSMQDALTKLSNRAAFDEQFAKAMVKYHQKPYDLAIVVIDLDNFKSINDTFGHAAGDKTLQIIAKTMRQTLPENVFVGRYGGEEFVLLFNNLKKAPLLNQLEVLRKKVESLPFKFKNTKVTITISVGATHVKPEDNVHIAFERADTGLYQAKEQGKNRVVYI